MAVSQLGVSEGAGASDGGDTRQRVEMNRSALFVPGGAAAVGAPTETNRKQEVINDAAAGQKRRRSAAAAAMGNTPLSHQSTPFILIFLFHLNTFHFFLVAIDVKVLIIFLGCFISFSFLVRRVTMTPEQEEKTAWCFFFVFFLIFSNFLRNILKVM